MDLDIKQQFKKLYEKMFSASQSGHQLEANHFRVLMENLRLDQITNRNLTPPNLSSLPLFVKQTLNKSQKDLNLKEASNCINTAFNYHAKTPDFAPITPIEFLLRMQNEFIQIASNQPLEIGDLVVFWSRNDNQWRDRKIILANLRPELPGFPFGLVFDHVAVYVGDNKLFHKPDPTFSSKYQINEWDDVVGFNEVLAGFELTFHRKMASILM